MTTSTAKPFASEGEGTVRAVSGRLKQLVAFRVGDLAETPSGRRFRAWWHGCPVESLPHHAPDLPRETRTGTIGQSDPRPSLTDPGVPAPDAEAEGTGTADVEDGLDRPGFWTAERMIVAQKLWGEGALQPGGIERSLQMIAPLGLGRESSIIQIGAGLGGEARAMASRHGAWVTALEGDPVLVRLAQAESRRAGLERQAVVAYEDLGNLSVRAHYFDGAFSRETLHTVEDKPGLLAALQEGLKENAPLMLSDLFLAPGVASDDSRLDAWRRAEPGAVFPVPAAEINEGLRQLMFDLRADEDITEAYRTDILAGWERFIADHEAEGLPQSLRRAVVSMAELWGRRMMALESGLLVVRRFLAIRR